jgi:polysaccharide pyruvyl transferase WcaK-like protein
MSPKPLRIGLFGEFGVANLGNDASLEAILAILRRRLPDAGLICICRGPEAVAGKYSIEAWPMNWAEEHRFEWRPLDVATRVVGKPLDMFRMVRMVGRCDVVMVPGTGIFDEIGVHPWAIPYALFRLAFAARLRGVRLGFAGVGVDAIRNPHTRRLMRAAAQCADLRSYRDRESRDAMMHNGVDASLDKVFPDIAFSLPTPPNEPAEPNGSVTVGLGVLDYYGPSGDPIHGAEIHERYLAKMVALAAALVDSGYRLRLFTGSYTDIDVAREIMRRLDRERESDTSTVLFEPPDSFAESMRQMAGLRVVVASRFHNLIAALKMGVGAVTLSYAVKGDALLQAVGLEDYVHHIETFDVDQVLDQVRLLDKRHQEIGAALAAVNAEYLRRLEELENDVVDDPIGAAR